MSTSNRLRELSHQSVYRFERTMMNRRLRWWMLHPNRFRLTPLISHIASSSSSVIFHPISTVVFCHLTILSSSEVLQVCIVQLGIVPSLSLRGFHLMNHTRDTTQKRPINAQRPLCPFNQIPDGHLTPCTPFAAAANYVKYDICCVDAGDNAGRDNWFQPNPFLPSRSAWFEVANTVCCLLSRPPTSESRARRTTFRVVMRSDALETAVLRFAYRSDVGRGLERFARLLE
ncbi:hypothetical protein L596_012268 [Steinernema carpocapsae]|uniref:Uncharacterized protein n=1 Tax=Steinernema carpocapsae TaxID=34508 RepID=A0A4U5NXD6_STECR|nr:hypothetical protein L596_012268 [Steinernema carpocapsae]